MSLFIFSFFILWTLALGFYSPDNHDDWLVLKPDSLPPPGSHASLPFKFGLIPNPYKSVEEFYLVPSTVGGIEAAGAVVDSPELGGGDTSITEQNTQKDLLNDEVAATSEEDSGNIFVSSYGLHSPHGGLVQKRDKVEASDNAAVEAVGALVPVACTTDTVLQLSLKDGILRLEGDRIGSIVSNHQFQFDGPTPQHGAIYAAGWLVTPNGVLSLGGSTLFYQCTSGDFYKLYDELIGAQCSPVQLDVIELVAC
ncbi:hypothetical protein PUMCH_000926 [Australozyma saopauloensis]|uniref:Cell wall mannoprotein PIR1-like C-terminal domain-containing protein n=1 Tax=Australozyma saopauloensis TaxID=291208 RepID=A0AAX4H5T8_9ASCO|nr:hypothetical protein PUMCH_000926 [[Candida] saopauloensis]